jgi:hypothetical protein
MLDSGYAYQKQCSNGQTLRFKQEWIPQSDGRMVVMATTERGDVQRYYKKDFQRTRCYTVEERIKFEVEAYKRPIDIQEAQALATQVCEAYGLTGADETVKVVMNPKRVQSCFYRPGERTVYLQGWGLTVGVVLHEVCHHVARMLTRNLPYRIVAHGPEFMTFLFEIYEEFLGCDLARFRGSRVRSKGLQFAEEWHTRPVIAGRQNETEQHLMDRVAQAEVALAQAQAALTQFREGR